MTAPAPQPGRDSAASGRGGAASARPSGADTRPAAMCSGPGHLVVYGNAAFVTAFGRAAIGMPAREILIAFPAAGFALLDAVLAGGRPLARWIRLGDQDWRLTAMARVDPETLAPYGVSFHLRRRSDLPVVLDTDRGGPGGSG